MKIILILVLIAILGLTSCDNPTKPIEEKTYSNTASSNRAQLTAQVSTGQNDLAINLNLKPTYYDSVSPAVTDNGVCLTIYLYKGNNCLLQKNYAYNDWPFKNYEIAMGDSALCNIVIPKKDLTSSPDKACIGIQLAYGTRKVAGQIYVEVNLK